MQHRETIKEALDLNARLVKDGATTGRGTAKTTVRWRHGLTAEAQDGPWKLVVAMAEKYGGDNAGPNPGVVGRTALGSCLVIGYAMWAARLGVPIRALSVEVQADYDVRGELAIEETARPGYQAIRYVVAIESDAPEAEIMAMLDLADRHSSWLDIVANPVAIGREVRLNRPTAT